MTPKRSWRAVFWAAAAALLVAILGGLATDIGPWYQSLRQPAWKPPDWAFGPAWTLIYSLAAASGVTAWRAAPKRTDREWLLVLFSLNAFLNVLWSLLFFRLHRPDWAMIEVVFLWLSVLLLMLVLGRYSRKASALLAVYLLWTTFAATLNWHVVQLNGPF